MTGLRSSLCKKVFKIADKMPRLSCPQAEPAFCVSIVIVALSSSLEFWDSWCFWKTSWRCCHSKRAVKLPFISWFRPGRGFLWTAMKCCLLLAGMPEAWHDAALVRSSCAKRRPRSRSLIDSCGCAWWYFLTLRIQRPAHLHLGWPCKGISPRFEARGKSEHFSGLWNSCKF